MAAPQSSFRSSLQDVLSPNDAVASATAQWLKSNRRRVVKPIPMTGRVAELMRFQTLPEWPGAGTIQTVSDSLPIVCVPGMPAKEYPHYVSALTAYTLAELAATSPQVATQVWTPSLMHLASLVVATRAGVWAALNRTPDVAASISSRVLRWSATHASIIVREASAGDESELWRLSLASSPGMPTSAVAAFPALVGSAPAQFLMGGTLLIQAGEVYAMHYLEGAIRSFLRSMVPVEVAHYMRLDSRGTWDTLNAAAIGGFSVSVIRSLISDRMFTLCANLRVAMSDAAGLRVQIERMTAGAPVVHRGFPLTATFNPERVRQSNTPPADDDDTASVVDSEVGDVLSPFHTPRAGSPAGRGRHSPPDLAPDVQDDLRDAIRAVPRMNNDVASIARMQAGSDSIRF